MKKKSDRSIIMKLYTKTRTDDLKWYISFSDENVEVWKSSKKITKSKSLSCVINYRKKDPQSTIMNFFMEEKKYKNDIIKEINMVKLKDIKKPNFIFLLLKKILEKNNYEVKKIIYGIILNNENPNFILMLEKDGKLILPYEKDLNYNKMVDSLINEIKINTGLKVNKIENVSKNIIKYNNEYMLVYPYIINEYVGKEGNLVKWIHLNNIHNFDIEDKSLKMLNIYKKNK